MSSCIQPPPLNNHHHKAITAAATTTTSTNNNNDDYQVALTNMIGRDLNFMKETMTEIQKFVDHMNVQINQACEKFEELKTREGGSHTNELDQLKMSVKKLKSQIPSKLKIHCKISRFMISLWIGEGLLPPIKSMDQNTEEEIVLGKTAEDFVNEILDELTAKGFIEPIYKNCGLAVDSYRMHPAIRSAVNIGRSWYELGLVYLRNQCLTFYNSCIVNVGAAIIDGRHEIIFKGGTNLKVVYLGRWQNSVMHHIEVPDIKILNALKNMKQLKFLSLRGISLITELPHFISQLTNLKILDLKACHNLEVVPNWIGLLKSLTHLDISECHFLDHMPKGLGSLSELQVLKGFIIGDSKDKSSCTIDDLTKLSKLRKLSIYTSKKEFPTNKQLCHLQRLNTLQKLKISWSSCILQREIDDIPKQACPQPRLRAKPTKALTRSFTKQHDSELPLQLELPSSLQKLELECFPEKITPSWLWSSKLKNLKKLYIRGGLLCYLGAIAATTVEMLQLKYLPQLEMHWLELRTLFPNLIYLEKVECPGLTFFPCDENGV